MKSKQSLTIVGKLLVEQGFEPMHLTLQGQHLYPLSHQVNFVNWVYTWVSYNQSSSHTPNKLVVHTPQTN